MMHNTTQHNDDENCTHRNNAHTNTQHALKHDITAATDGASIISCRVRQSMVGNIPVALKTDDSSAANHNKGRRVHVNYDEFCSVQAWIVKQRWTTKLLDRTRKPESHPHTEYTMTWTEMLMAYLYDTGINAIIPTLDVEDQGQVLTLLFLKCSNP